MQSDLLSSPIEFLKGVGPAKGELIKNELGVFTFGDLLEHYPFRYVDKSIISKVKDIEYDTEVIQLKGVIHSIKEQGFRGRGKRLTAKFEDETGLLELVWFQGVNWIKNSLKPGVAYLVYGKLNRFKGKLSLPHPELEIFDPNKKLSVSFEPVYSTTEKLRKKGLDSRGILGIQKNLASQLKPNSVQEFIPDKLLREYNLINRFDALQKIHFPKNHGEVECASRRIKFEEFFLQQLNLVKHKLIRQNSFAGYIFKRIDNYFDKFYEQQLSFELTGAQKRVVKEIRRDVLSGRQMNRLLQGDVGSGKTIVAVMAMLMAVDNGYQAAIMAPTEILAQQHYHSISGLLSDIGVRVELLTGSVKGEKRKNILKALRTGHLHILIATHALIEDKVEFENLGISVIDEQHRFGVAQRAKLWQKSATKTPPHVLVMTATPIPRTLAMTVYGDLDVSVIDEMPPGRKPVQTAHRLESHRLRVFGFMEEQIKEGRQIYIVYPLIEESEKLDMKNLMQGYEDIQARFPYPDYRTSVVHGRLKSAEKEAEMRRFVKGETQIMVATTVIEVGVDVPNASVMIIENAERFGLAQLHQLRGRVGRGADQSYCILITKDELTSYARKRIKTMVLTNNGFEIAEADLELRGPGDITGTQQSGDLQFKLASIARDQDILQESRDAAIKLLENDPELVQPENRGLRGFLSQHVVYSLDWSRIS